MAVTELYPSQEMRITKEGTVMTRFFQCLSADLPLAGANILPLIGDYWDVDRSELRVSEITTAWIDNVHCRVTAFYSTKGTAHKSKRADRKSSVQEIVDFSLEVKDATDTYYDYTEEDTVEWATTWKGVHADTLPPPLVVYKPKLTLSVKAYVLSWDFNNILNSIGRVNSADFVRQMMRDHRNRDVFYDKTGDDTGKWLFAGYRLENIGDQNVEVNMFFMYSIDGWNSPYGVTVAMYETCDFNALMPYPTNELDETGDAVR